MGYKIAFISPDNWMMELVPELRALGHEVVLEPSADCEAFICMSISAMDEALLAHFNYFDVPLFTYNWDVYEWVWSAPRYPGETRLYKKFGDLMKLSKEVWCPSDCTVLRTRQWYDLHSVTVKTFVPLKNLPDLEITDERYVLNTLRPMPDRQWGWPEKACEELGIPIKSPEHDAPWEDYLKLLAGCSFNISANYEASTGGLAMIEAAWYSKATLLCDSKWQGGKDYLGTLAYHFEAGNFFSLKKEIKRLWEDTPGLDVRPYLEAEYSAETMARRIEERLKRNL